MDHCFDRMFPHVWYKIISSPPYDVNFLAFAIGQRWRFNTRAIDGLKIHEKIYPKNVFQERKINFSEYYSFMGEILFNNIYESIQPFDNSLIVTEI